MKNLDQLHEVTDKALWGLTADESLKYRILQKAAMTGPEKSSRPGRRFIPVLCSSVALLLVCLFAVNGLKPVVPADMKVFPAGQLNLASQEGNQVNPSAAFSFPVLKPDSVTSVEWKNEGIVADSGICNKLIHRLQDQSEKKEDVPFEENGILIITAGDGTSFEYPVDEPYILEGGTIWDCSSFFELFRQSAD